MTRGRHRQTLPPFKIVSGAALGTLATAGVVVAVVTGDTQVLRVAVIASWLVALSLVGYTVRRGRAHAREAALVESARRREESVFVEQLGELGASIKALQAQLERMSDESAQLRAEVGQLRAEAAEAEAIVREARAERARAQLAEREAADQRLLTAAAFEAAAAVLQNFGQDGEEQPTNEDWVFSWVASLGAAAELDLTMHDDTIELVLADSDDEVEGAGGLAELEAGPALEAADDDAAGAADPAAGYDAGPGRGDIAIADAVPVTVAKIA